MKLYEKAAEANNSAALYDLACILESGTDEIEEDPERAVLLYEEAAKLEKYSAMTSLANIISKGQYGTTKDMSCLLYTSPSPRDQRGSRMPSSA